MRVSLATRVLMAASSQSNPALRKDAKKGSKLVFGSDGQRVLDRGVWKRFKYCQQCNLIIVERAKWAKNWDDVKYCSDKCRSQSKGRSRTSTATDNEPPKE